MTPLNGHRMNFLFSKLVTFKFHWCLIALIFNDLVIPFTATVNSSEIFFSRSTSLINGIGDNF